MRKSKQDMLETILGEMVMKQGITEISPGGVARTFAEILVEEFYQFYDELDSMLLMNFVSTAVGRYLDLIGELLDCTRNQGESDADYRYRITQQVYVVQGANLTAIRVKVLQLDGVADVQFKRFTNGAGSFTCYVIPEVYPLTSDVLRKVEAVVNEVAGYGIYGEVKASMSIPVDMNLEIFFRTETTTAERQSIRQQISSAVEGYVRELRMGDAIIINEIIQRVMDVSTKILDMQIQQVVVSDVNQYIRNIYPKADEQFTLRRISVV